MLYTVIRPHLGGMYFDGETRELDEATGTNLVRLGILAKWIQPENPEPTPKQVDTIDPTVGISETKDLERAPKNKSKRA